MKPISCGSSTVFSELFSGAFTFTLILLNCCVFSTLIFKGPIAPYISIGMLFFLLGAVAVQCLVNLRTSFKTLSAGPQEAPTILLAGLAATILANSGGTTTPESLFASIITIFGIAATLTGISFWLIGRFGVGYLMDYIPFPVICGFFAGIGFLLIKNACGILAEPQFGTFRLDLFFNLSFLSQIVLPVLLAASLVLFPRWLKSHLWFPALVILSIGLFYIYFLTQHLSIGQAQARGWLFGPFNAQTVIIRPDHFLAAINWNLVINNLGSGLIVVVVASSNLLLNVMGLSLHFNQEIDLNRELRLAGVSNLITAILGGTIGYHYFSTSIINHQVGSRSKGSSIVVLILSVAALFWGSQILSGLPRPVLVAILLAIGWRFLQEWLWESRKRTSPLEFVVLWVIFGIIIIFGVLPGVAAGIMLASIAFVVQYSRSSIVKHELSLVTTKSNVEHRPKLKEIILQHGTEVYILSLQGYIFFGTSFNLLEQIKNRITNDLQPTVKYVVLDFRLVKGIDSSCIMRLSQIRRLLESRSATLVLCELSKHTLYQLAQSGVLAGPNQQLFATINDGLAWVESAIIHRAQPDQTHETITELLLTIFGNESAAQLFQRYLTLRYFATNQDIYRAGDKGTDLYLFESGQAGINIQSGAKTIRLSTIQAGTIIGEIAFFNGFSRTATVVADQPSTLYQLTFDNWETFKAAHPEIALKFYDFTIRLLSKRLIDRNREIQALLS